MIRGDWCCTKRYCCISVTVPSDNHAANLWKKRPKFVDVEVFVGGKVFTPIRWFWLQKSEYFKHLFYNGKMQEALQKTIELRLKQHINTRCL